jgi:UDPglucose--hexose-1-phosphate uridylyltransferase
VQPPGIFRNGRAEGRARVVCYSPLHNTTLAELPPAEIRQLLECWQEQYRELGGMAAVDHVLIFENKGTVVGVSNPHPHCQIYATNFVFKTIAVEIEAGERYLKETGRVLFEDIVGSEQADGRRVIAENDSAIAFVPYFARYAYEAYVSPKQSHQSIADLSSKEIFDLAAMLKDLLVRYDNLWQMSFPYVLVLHQAPTNGRRAEGFHFHIEIHPPLRTPTLLKYLAGPEIGGGNFLSDTSPEQKAAELRALSATHYKQASEAHPA